MSDSRRRGWTLAIVSLGLFMVVLDNLVVNVALPSIRRDLGASIQALEWTVNAYVLSYAVLLLTGSALGDRFGRKRMFMAGIAIFTVSSAAAALAPSIGTLVAARAVEGVGAAIATPLTLTLLAEAFPPDRRGVAIGVWSGISGIAVALGPLVGGAMVQAASWHWIFWINVPIGLALVPLAASRLSESFGPAGALDLPGLALGSSGLFGLVFGLIRSQSVGWTSTEVIVSLAAGVALLVAFSFLSWFLRVSMSVAYTERIKAEFGISPQEMGYVLSSFLVVYALLMAPGGWFIDRFGARTALLVMGLGLALFGGLTGLVGPAVRLLDGSSGGGRACGSNRG